MKKTKINVIDDLKNLGSQVREDLNAPYGFILLKMPGHERQGTNFKAKSPGSLAAFKEVLNIDFTLLKSGKEGNIYHFTKEQTNEVLNEYFHVVKQLADYKPEDHPNIRILEESLEWEDETLVVILYKNEEDMP